MRLIVSCEHAGNHVPSQYIELFRGEAAILESHRGYDPGSLELGRRFARRFKAPFYAARMTRLLVELNRSLGHARLFSEFSQPLDQDSKQRLLDRFYFPHRHRVQAAIAALLLDHPSVLHVSVHTFAPQLNGHVRCADVGLLYDPRREVEKSLCGAWCTQLKTLRRDLLVRRNYPYLGKADGFTTYLRTRFPTTRYAGIELEVNQRWLTRPKAWRQLADDITRSLPAL